MDTLVIPRLFIHSDVAGTLQLMFPQLPLLLPLLGGVAGRGRAWHGVAVGPATPSRSPLCHSRGGLITDKHPDNPWLWLRSTPPRRMLLFYLPGYIHSHRVIRLAYRCREEGCFDENGLKWECDKSVITPKI